MKIKKTALIIICSIFLNCFSVFVVNAEELPPEEIIEATVTDAQYEAVEPIEKYDEKKGIATVRLMYCADSGARDIIKNGYAFFIGGGDNSVYLISCCDTVILTEEEKAAVAASHGVEKDKVNTAIELVLKNDVIIELSIVNSSVSMDFAILQPTSEISSCTTIRLCTDVNTIKNGTAVHTYDNDMQMVDCTIEDWSEINDAHYFLYSSNIPITKGLPILNDDGEAVGIISNANKGNPEQLYALQIDEVIDVLDILNIQYNPKLVVNTSDLEETMKSFEETDGDNYTPETWTQCQAYYDDAKKLMSQIGEGEVTSYTQDEINQLNDDFTESMSLLQEKGISVKTVIIVSVIVNVVLLVTIIVLTILLILKGKKYKRQIKEEENRTITAKEALKLSGRVTPGAIPNTTNRGMPVNRSIGDTGSAGVPSETTVLSAGMEYQENVLQSYPTLMRYKTGESVIINQNSFIVGSAPEFVDYCIRYNNNISRKHACIMKLEDGYYIQDLETTNGTYVNGMRVASGRYVKLVDGSIIKMAEEEFEFKE
ncbi:MAG: FHA domain-containing protein [Clostridium sp.]|nr:FHA domain-containing protein [Clostridium sp.]MCM1170731.1 FHA domain-containing protein [Clostridium sp.]MCM1207605.1 FHA domain-containing protein [Ruminococcus sp.]